MKRQTKFKETEIGMIPEDWELMSIGEVAEVIGGTTPSTKEPDNFGGDVAWLTPKDLSNHKFRYIERGERNITQKGLDSKGLRLVPKGTVLLTTRAPIGYIAIAKNKVTTNQGFRSLVPNNKTSSGFLYYLLKNNTERLIANASGTTFGELAGSTLKSLKFGFPEFPEQTRIAQILSSLDDGIELNHQMNAKLEKIGQALFKHWFIDFEFPNEKGKPYKSSGGKMVDSELGEIPQGWVVGTLGDICDITMGQSPPGHSYNEDGNGLPFYQGIADFGFRFPNRRVYCTAPTRFAEEADVLLSVRAPVGAFNVAEERCAIGRGVAALRLKEKHNGFLYYLLRTTRSKWEKFEAEGTIFGSVTKSDVHDFKVVIPPQPILVKFASLIEGMEGKININEKQSRALSAIRDSLLPRLMSGKIRVQGVRDGRKM